MEISEKVVVILIFIFFCYFIDKISIKSVSDET